MSGSIATKPTLPQVQVNYPYSLPVGGATYDCTTTQQFRDALLVVEPGDVIILHAGTTYVGPFVLREYTGPKEGWVYIISNQLASLPPEGTRINPLPPGDIALPPGLVGANDQQYMPKINGGTTRSSVAAAIQMNWRAHHYRFSGIEFVNDNDIDSGTGDPTTINITYGVISCKPYGVNSIDSSYNCHHLVFDRCYIHARPLAQTTAGIQLNCGEAQVTDCWIHEIHTRSFECQGITVTNGSGPYRIENNFIQGGGENMMMGGAKVYSPTLVPNDVVIRKNHFYCPQRWNPASPDYAGTKWAFKNVFELKIGIRVLVEYNVFENSWSGGQTGQGPTVKCSNQDGTSVWSETRDVTIRKNLVLNCWEGMQMNGRDSTSHNNGILYLQRVLWEDCLFLNIQRNRNWYSSPGASYIDPNTQVSDGGKQPADVIVDHCTMINIDVVGSSEILLANSTTPCERWEFTNNVTCYGQYGWFASGGATGNALVAAVWTPGKFTNNLHFLSSNHDATYPAGQFWEPSLAACGFVDSSDPFSMDPLDWIFDAGSLYKAGGARGGKNDAGALDGSELGVRDIAGMNTIWNGVRYGTATAPANTAPVATARSGISRVKSAGASNSQIATVSDAEQAAGTLTVAIQGALPTGITVTNLTNTGGIVTADIAAGGTANVGNNTFTLRVTDSGALFTDVVITVAVTAANTAPTITPAAQVSLVRGQVPINATIATVSDAETAANALVISLVTVPTGILVTNVVNTNGVVTADVQATTTATLGVNGVVVRVTDGGGLTADGTFNVNVTPANVTPTITAAAGVARAQGAGPSVATVATVSDPEDAAGALAVTAVTVPAGLLVTNITNTNGTVTATIEAQQTATTGANTIVFRVTDSGGLTADANFVVTVQTGNTGPSITPGPQKTVTQNTTSNNVPIATVSDVEDPAGTLTVTVQGTLPTGLTIDTIVNTNGAVTARIVATAGASTGTKNITLRVTDSGGAFNETTFVVVVQLASAQPVLVQDTTAITVVRTGPAVTFRVGTVSDPQDAPNQIVVYTTFVSSGLVVTIQPTDAAGNVYASVASTTSFLGNQQVTFRARDTNGNVSSAVATVTVRVVANQAPTVTPATTQSIQQGSVGTAGVGMNLATVSDDVDLPGSLTIDIQAVSHPSIVVSSVQNLGGTVTGLVEVGLDVPVGQQSITVRATDSGGLAASSPFLLNVTAAAGSGSTPTIAAATPVVKTQGDPASTATIATVSDPVDPADALVVATEGALPTGVAVTSITVLSDGMVRADVAADMTAATGPNVVGLRVTNLSGGTADASFTVQVQANVAPTISAKPAVDRTRGAAALPAQVAQVADATTPAASLTVEATSVPAGLTVSNITVASSGLVTANIAAAVGAALGVNLITFRVTDGGGLTATAEFTVNVLRANTGPPQVTPVPITRVQGSQAQPAVLATVSDPDDSSGALTPQVESLSPGLLVTNIANINGTIVADVQATAGAVVGANTIGIGVVDSGGQKSTATINVTVSAPVGLGRFPRLTLMQVDPLPLRGPYRIEGSLITAEYVTSVLTQATGDFFVVPFRATDAYVVFDPSVTLTIERIGVGASLIRIANGVAGASLRVRVKGTV